MIGRRLHRVLSLIAATTLVLSFAAPAMAAQAVVTSKLVAGTTDVQFWPEAEPGRNVTVVSVTVPATTKLPVRVRIPIPIDAQVVWAGEILGGDPSKDPKREFKVVEGEGGTAAEFELTEAKTGQIEAVGGPLKQKDGIYTAESRWVQSTPSKLTGMAIRLPAGATAVVSTPTPTGNPDTNPTTKESLYPLPSRNFKTGEGETVTVTWKIVPANSTKPATSGQNSPIPLLIGLLAAAVVALVVVLMSQRARSRAASAPEKRVKADPSEASDDDDPFDTGE